MTVMLLLWLPHSKAYKLCLECWQDWESVVEYLMQRGEAERALPVLRRPGVSQELWYKFAPALMALAPTLTVEAWMASQPPLEPPRYVLQLMTCNIGQRQKHKNGQPCCVAKA